MWTLKIGLTERLKIAMDAKLFSIVGRLLAECGVPPDMEGCTPEGAAYWMAVEVLELHPEKFSVPKIQLDNPWIHHVPKKELKEVKSEVEDETNQEFLKYSNTGKPLGMEKRLLNSRGFREGSTVSVQAGRANEGASFVIKSIDDRGIVKLKPLDASGIEKGQLLKSECKNFMAKYEISDKQAIIDFDYPNDDIRTFDIFESMTAQAIITTAMLEYYTTYSPLFGIAVQQQPKTMVRVVNEFAKKKMLMPVFGIVCHGPLEDGVPDRAFEVKNHNVDDRVFWIKPHVPVEDEVVGVAPSNYVRYSPQPGEVHTISITITITITATIIITTIIITTIIITNITIVIIIIVIIVIICHDDSHLP